MVPVSDIPQAAQWPALPALRDFIVSAGFGGAAVLLAAAVTICAVIYASSRATRRLNRQLEQQDRHHQETREDQQRAAAIDRCWQRLVWLVKTAGMEPTARDTDEASLGLGPELTLELLQGLLRDAKDLGDDTLARAVTVYLTQYGLVLGQRGGPLPAALAERDGHPPSSPDDKPAAVVTAHEAAPATPQPTVSEGRHR
jgi:hypothetical protein